MPPHPGPARRPRHIQSFDFAHAADVQDGSRSPQRFWLFGDLLRPADRPATAGADGSDDDSTHFPIRSTSPTGQRGSDHRNTRRGWTAAMFLPYRRTVLGLPRSARRASGGFEGMAMPHDGTKLYPMLENPLTAPGTIS